jgi:hypothetical protein
VQGSHPDSLDIVDPQIAVIARFELRGRASDPKIWFSYAFVLHQDDGVVVGY